MEITSQNFSIEQLEEAIKSQDSASAKEAENELVQRAESGDIKSADVLSSVYSDGAPCIPKSYNKAYKYTEIVANSGSTFARFWLAQLQYNAGDFQDALANALQAYKEGEGQGGELAARMLIESQGVEGRSGEGLAILETLAEQSSDSARLTLAYYYLQGTNIPEDIEKAFHYASKVHESHYKVSEFLGGKDKAAMAYYVRGYAAYQMEKKGKNAGGWHQWMEKAANLGHAGAKKLLEQSGGQSTKMGSTIKGEYQTVEVAPGEFEISYKKFRTIFLVMFIAGFIFTITIFLMMFGIPLLFIGGIGLFLFRTKGKLTIVKGQGIKYETAFGVEQIPFADIQRVGWKKANAWVNIYHVTVDTKGQTVTVAKNVSQAVAQDLQQLILNG